MTRATATLGGTASDPVVGTVVARPHDNDVGLRINLVKEKLRGTKPLDLFECTRLDSKVSVEETIATFAKLKDEGKFDHIGMSECSAETLHRGHEVRMHLIHPISPFSYEQQTREGAFAEVSNMHPCSFFFRSPFGGGFLTGQIKRPEDITEGDSRRHLPRFREDVGFHTKH
ncbi:NADP-dependent oxidoreductase domain-containing protein [Lanmaoa asiatica]|nr:NADP-dependent oxidoreductase domain-containing protein [Lanmaoa asiatica]